jgi:hypothetical protein
MHLTIVPSDTTVCVDYVCYQGFDMAGVPLDVHALQWQDVEGYIELKNYVNEPITTLPAWATTLYDAWLEKDYIEKHPPAPTPEQIQELNRYKANDLLQKSDWSVLPDVPLANRDAWISYRQILREVSTNPPLTPFDFPPEPPVIWA